MLNSGHGGSSSIAGKSSGVSMCSRGCWKRRDVGVALFRKQGVVDSWRVHDGPTRKERSVNHRGGKD